MLKLDEPFRDTEIFNRSVLVFEDKRFVRSFWLIFLPLGYGDPHIFANPDPGSHNVELLPVMNVSFLSW